MLKKIAIVSILLFVSWVWFGLSPKEIRAAEEGKNIPKITQFFAAKSMKPGSLWKIYLNVSCPPGKIRVLSEVDQQGQQDSYPLAFTRIKERSIRIKEGGQQEASGYLSLNIPGQSMNNQNIKLRLIVQSSSKSSGSSVVTYSEPIELPLAISNSCMFDKTCVDETPPSGVFQENNYIGPILVHLEPSGRNVGSGIEQAD